MAAHSITKIHTRFKGYNKELRDIWESYCLVDFYMANIHDLLKSKNVPPLTFTNLSGKNKTLSDLDTFGAISYLTRKANPQRTLITAVSHFEHYLGFLTKTVYHDYPKKLISNNLTTEKEEQNLIRLIVDSVDRDEIIERIVEEKVRGIFYGKPSDFFLKDKAKLELGSHFRDNYSKEIEKYEEITARRNAIIHNQGRVDRKYIREVKNNSLILGQIITLDANYLRESIDLLRNISAQATKCIIENIYKGNVQGVLARTLSSL
jgi:hypothetical protein